MLIRNCRLAFEVISLSASVITPQLGYDVAGVPVRASESSRDGRLLVELGAARSSDATQPTLAALSPHWPLPLQVPLVALSHQSTEGARVRV